MSQPKDFKQLAALQQQKNKKGAGGGPTKGPPKLKVVIPKYFLELDKSAGPKDMIPDVMDVKTLGALFAECVDSTDLGEDKWNKLEEAFAYLGFDAMHMFLSLVDKARKKGITRAQFIEHMKACNLLYVSRGSSIIKIGERGTETVNEFIAFMAAVYGLEMSVEKAANRRDVVTLPRLSSVFPQNCVHFLLIGKGRVPEVGGGHESVGPYRFPAGASVIPKKQGDFFKKWLAWAVDFDILINSGNTGNHAPNADSVTRYAKIAYNSTWVPEDARDELWNEVQEAMKA